MAVESPREAHRYTSVTVPGRVEWVPVAAEFIVRSARQMQVPAAFEPLFEP